MTTKQMEQWMNQRGTVSTSYDKGVYTSTWRSGKEAYSAVGHTLEDAIEMLYNWVSRLEK